MRFSLWFTKLLYVNTVHGEFGEEYPMGCCLYRDVLRDEKVKDALRESWNAKMHPDNFKDGSKHTQDCGDEV